MKNKIGTIFLIIIITTIIPFCILGKTKAGIFFNVDDYKEKSLNIVFDCNKLKQKNIVHSFFNSNIIYFKNEGKKQRLSIDSIWGYEDCKGNVCRFKKGSFQEFKIIEENTLILYTALLPVVSNSGKKIQLVPTYYFSRSLNSDIMQLSIYNIIKALPENYLLYSILNSEFGNDKLLTEFDSKINTYKINIVLSKFIK